MRTQVKARLTKSRRLRTVANKTLSPDATQDASSVKQLDASPQLPKSRRGWIIFAIVIGALIVSTVLMFLVESSILVGVFALVMMLSLIFLKVPVAFAMIIPSILGMYVLRGVALVQGQLATEIGRAHV